MIPALSCSGKQFNQNTDDYYNTPSYPFQEERYGQDEEDRQWDSGGYAPKHASGTGKRLPTLPSAVAKRRGSVINTEEIYDGTYGAPTPTPGRRKCLPQIPTKRSTSRQSSIHDDFDGYRTPTETSRGASLPPTPTKTQKTRLLPQANKQPNSLPPTPGRQLPKPSVTNLNNRTAKSRRANLMKRTSSAEYTDANDVYDPYYTRAGAMSARDNYNEDYNYAYQSTDNLPAQPEQEDTITNVAAFFGFGKKTVTTSVTTTISTSVVSTVTTTSTQSAQNYYNNTMTTMSTSADYKTDYKLDYKSDYQTDYKSEYQSDFKTDYQAADFKPLQYESDFKSTTDYQTDYKSDYQTDYDQTDYQSEYKDEYKSDYQTDYQSDYYYNEDSQTLTGTDYYQNEANTKNTEQYSSLISTSISNANSSYDYTSTAIGQSVSTTSAPSTTANVTSNLASAAVPSVAKAASNLLEGSTSTLKFFGSTLSGMGSMLKSSLMTPAPTSQQNQPASQQLQHQVQVSQSSYNTQPVTSSYDSMTVHDDEFKNTFDTAISSISSSIANQYPEYSVSGMDMTTTMSTTYDNSYGYEDYDKYYYETPTSGVQTTTAQYNRDQTDSNMTQAIVTNGTATSYAQSVYSTTGQTIPTSGAVVNGTAKMNGLSRGYLQQQETIDVGWQPGDALMYGGDRETYYEEDENYLEEEEELATPVNGGDLAPAGNAIINRESPQSVIHVEAALRRGSSQLTVVDPYQQAAQPGAAKDYPSRRPSAMDAYAPDNHRASLSDANQMYDEYGAPRKPSVDSYGNAVVVPGATGVRRTSGRQSPDQMGQLERQETTEVFSPDQAEMAPQEKKVSFEEEEEQKPPRPQVTAQQRWHWAYNKIIMQLNVSDFILVF